MDTARLDNTLRRTGRIKFAVDTLRASGRVLAALLTAAILVILADAVIAFGAAGLIVVDALLVALCVTALVYVIRVGVRNAYDPRRIARLIESGAGVEDSSLINAVEFAERGRATDTRGSAALRDLAITRGVEAASRVNPAGIIDRRPLKRTAVQMAISVAAILLAYVAAPKLFHMVVPRYLSPTADLPPFTLLDFDVTTSPQKLYHGKPATIRAALAGPVVPEQASVVFIEPNADGRARRRSVPMLRDADGSFALPLQRVTSRRVFYIDTPEGRSHRHTLDVLPTPTFEKVTVRYNYPDYTDWPTVTRPLDETGIRGIRGTWVTVAVTSNLPLRTVRLNVHHDGDTHEYSAAEQTQADAPATERDVRLRLERSGTFQLTLVAEDGTTSDRSVSGPLVVDTDAAPQVQIMSPDLRVVVPEGFDVPFDITAQDDVAVARVVLHRRVDDGESTPTELDLNRRGPTYATARHTLKLADTGAKADDKVRVFVTAFDNLPGAPQSADSATVEIAVVTREKFDELARQQYRIEHITAEVERFMRAIADVNRMRDALIEELEALKQKMAEQGGELNDDDRTRLEEIRTKLEALEQQAKALAEAMRQRASQDSLYEFERSYKDTLNQLAEQMDKQAASAAAQRASLDEDATAPDVDKALSQLKRDRGDAERAQQASEMTEKRLRQLEHADRMMYEAESIKAITKRQRELADRLATYKDSGVLTPSQAARARRLADEQRRLRRELSESLDRLIESATEARSELPTMAETAIDLANHIRDIGVLDDQRNAAAQADDANGPRAHASADDAATKLESLIRKCDGVGQCAGDDLDGQFNLTQSQMNNMMRQLAQGRQGRGRSSGRRGASQGAGAGTGSSGNFTGGAPTGDVTLAGPQVPGLQGGPQIMLQRPRGSYGRVGDGESSGVGRNGPQRLNPQTRDARATPPGGTFGVPAPYRPLAEQYFRRLAEDSR